jgi:hypothetical protein
MWPKRTASSTSLLSCDEHGKFNPSMGEWIMPRTRLDFSAEPVVSPLTFWVHKGVDAEVWSQATVFEPPLPGPLSGKGYARYTIQYRDQEFYFASLDELEHCMAVLSQKVLPTTRRLADKAGFPSHQHLHWLSKWPAGLKSWKERQVIVRLLDELIKKGRYAQEGDI